MGLADFSLDNVNSLLVSEQGRIGPDIYQKKMHTSPWLTLVNRGQWPDEMGDLINVLTWERALPGSALSWTDVNLGAFGAGENSCAPTAAVVNFAQTVRSYKLSQTAIETPMFCANDLRFPVKRQEQLAAMLNILSQNTGWAWENRYRDEYFRLCEHKIVASPGLPEDSTAFDLPGDLSKISMPAQGVLDFIHLKLSREGATSWGTEEGRPIYCAIMSPEAQEWLNGRNAVGADSVKVREDYRHSAKVHELLAPLGVERTYKGWFHLMDMFIPRYNITGGDTLVKVEPFVSEATTNGNRWIVNPAYALATHEVMYVYSREVYECLVPSTITSPGGGTKFDPVSYMGDFKWKNVVNVDKNSDYYNPDGTMGFFRGILSSASKPVSPDLGYALLFRRAPQVLGLVDAAGEPIIA